jgi:hypothetical protein
LIYGSWITHAAARAARLVVAVDASTALGAAAVEVDQDSRGLHFALFARLSDVLFGSVEWYDFAVSNCKVGDGQTDEVGGVKWG